MAAPGDQRVRVVRIIAGLGGVLLFVIGVRFLVVPDQATRSFGLARDIAGFELHTMIGLRDLWLGALAVAFALAKQWRALSLWFGFGAFVCFADAAVAWGSSGRTGPVAFHVVCGLLSVALATTFHRYAALIGRDDRP